MIKAIKIACIFLMILAISVGMTYFSFHYIYTEGTFNDWYESFCYILCVVGAIYLTTYITKTKL